MLKKGTAVRIIGPDGIPSIGRYGNIVGPCSEKGVFNVHLSGNSPKTIYQFHENFLEEIIGGNQSQKRSND
jgi:hypothetical protein